MSGVREVQSDAEFKELLASRKDQVIAVDFTASWCGPCKSIAPLYAQLSEQYKELLFLKVDVDKLRDTAARYSVSAMPTFMFFKNGNKVQEFRGANAETLKSTVRSLATGGGGGGDVSSSTSGEKGSVEEGDLYEVIEVTGTHCLNEQQDHCWKELFKKEDTAYLESDCDEQLLLTIGFRGMVKVKEIKLAAVDLERAPKNIKLFTNQSTLDFDAAGSLTPIAEVSLTQSDYDEESKVATIAVKLVKFQNVSSLTLFVEDNLGGAETTAIKSLTLLGDPSRIITKVNEVLS